jgi:hypothetical protein
MRIKQPGWIPFGTEADLAIRRLSGNGARLFFHLYFRANRQNGRLDVRYDSVASALERSKRSIVTDFAELREKGACLVDSAVNQHTLVHVEICDMFWPFEKASPKNSDIQAQYLSQIRALLGSRECIKCDFGPSDQMFAQDLFARSVPIEQIRRAIDLGCSRKYASLLNGTDDKLISRFAYFQDLIEEASEADPKYWTDIGTPVLAKLEIKWLASQRSASPNSAPARRKSKKETR